MAQKHFGTDCTQSNGRLQVETNLLKMVDGEPNLPLSVEHATKVTPGHCKAGLSFNRFQVTCLKNAQATSAEGTTTAQVNNCGSGEGGARLKRGLLACQLDS